MSEPGARSGQWVAVAEARAAADGTGAAVHRRFSVGGAPVRTVAAVVAKLDLSAFGETVQSAGRSGGEGRDRSGAAGGAVAVWLHSGDRVGAGVGAALRGERAVPLAVRRGECEPPRSLAQMFRTDHGAALDELFTQVIASLVDQELVSVSRVSQDGVRVRVSAGAGSFRREERLRQAVGREPEACRN